MVSLVVDASVAIAAVLIEDNSDHALQIFDRVAETGAIVPNLWHLEVGQALLGAERRRRIDTAGRLAIQARLLELPITVDSETAVRALTETALLAAQHRLTLYDAAYLELSQRRTLPLATFDNELRRAAALIGVALL